MGSLLSCISNPCPSASPSGPPPAKRRSSTSSRGRASSVGARDSAKAVAIDEEALAAAAAFVLGQRPGAGAFERSASVRHAGKRQGQGPLLPRSCSTRPRSLADPELQPQQLVAKVREPMKPPFPACFVCRSCTFRRIASSAYAALNLNV
jgi:hypothetical protein